jgi:hypothetical protein
VEYEEASGCHGEVKDQIAIAVAIEIVQERGHKSPLGRG